MIKIMQIINFWNFNNTVTRQLFCEQSFYIFRDDLDILTFKGDLTSEKAMAKNTRLDHIYGAVYRADLCFSRLLILNRSINDLGTGRNGPALPHFSAA